MTASAIFVREGLGRASLPQVSGITFHVRTFASRPRKPRKGKNSQNASESESTEEGQEKGPLGDAGGGAAAGALVSKEGPDFSGSMVPRVDPLDVQNVVVIGTPRPFFPGFGTLGTFANDDDLTQALMGMAARKAPAYVGFFLRKNLEDSGKEQQPGIEVVPTSSPTSGGSAAASGLGAPMLVTPPGPQDHDAAVRDALKKRRPRLATTITEVDDVYKMGTLVEIHYAQSGNNMTQFIFGAHHRVEIEEAFERRPLLMAKIRHHHDVGGGIPFMMDEQERNFIKAYMLEIRQALHQLTERGGVLARSGDFNALWLFRDRAQIEINPGWLCDYAVEFCRNAEPLQLQEVLETLDLKMRMHKTVVLLKRELEIIKIKEEINKKTNESIDSRQRKYLLEEKLKSIKKELGQKDDKEPLFQKWKERTEGRKVPDEVKKVIEEEQQRLSMMEPHSMEFNLIRTYLDWLTVLPWGVFTEENFDLAAASAILNQDHYGMEDVKERILQFIAVGKLRGSVPQGKILCLVGPPGVGKTSIGKSIARALSRKFYRFSVGGMNDVAEIKGHRRTYVGAMPGKLIQALKSAEAANPVILIDEIDKIGHGGMRGDPTSALLEVLDPEQNSTFMDHYLDVPVDLSKVLFICTANVRDTIPDALRDRMDFIQLSGYVGQEKLHIVKQYLEPLERERAGLKPEEAHLHDDAIEALVRWYCREAGVRSLQRHINKIYNKAAFKKVSGESTPFHITEANLDQYVGKQKYISDRMYDRPPAGVVMGLAYSANGGSTLYIESTVADWLPAPAKQGRKQQQKEEDTEEDAKGSGSLFATGQMGGVMKESTDIAYTCAKAVLHRLDPTSRFFQTRRIHMHVPEGATPKDGPSAGITMVTSLLSLALNMRVKADIAMTGEITLTGKVLPIGGVKEKTMSAKRSLVKEIILPTANRKDWDELPEFVREGMTVHFVDYYDEVFQVCFPDWKGPRSVGTAASADACGLPSASQPQPQTAGIPMPEPSSSGESTVISISN